MHPNAALSTARIHERIAKGRPALRHTVVQWDQTARRCRPATVAPDPILDLAVARTNFRRCRPSGEIAGSRYGEILQRVVSPVYFGGVR